MAKRLHKGIMTVAGVVLLLACHVFAETADAGPASLVFGGDVMLAANLPAYAPYNMTPLPYTMLFERIAPFIQAADLAFCNLENPISGRGARLESKQYAFNAPSDTAPALAAAGFDAVSLANNHCLDFGTVALQDTLVHLTAAQVRYAGIAPQMPVVLQAKGLRVAFLSYLSRQMYPPEFRPFAIQPAMADLDRMRVDIAEARGLADIVVVSLHWGYEFSPKHDRVQETMAHALVDAGAHIITGHHPHVQQEAEYYRGGIVLYSMGNLVFARYSKPESRQTRLYRICVDKTGVVSAEFLPIQIQEGGQPKPLAESFLPLPRTSP